MTDKNAVYTHGHHESVLRSHRWRTAENSAAYLLPHLRPGHVAAGRRLRARHHHRRPGGAGRARTWSPPSRSPRRRSPWPAPRRSGAARSNIEFAVADVHALDFPDDTFDVVHAHQVLQHVGDPVQALREMRRVCQARRDRRGPRQRLRRVHLVPRAARAGRVAGPLPAGRPGQRRRAGRRAAAAVLGPRGRASPTSRPPRRPGVSPTPEDRAWWGGMWAERILNSDMARQALASGAATEDDLRRISDGWRAWAAEPDGWCHSCTAR